MGKTGHHNYILVILAKHALLNMEVATAQIGPKEVTTGPKNQLEVPGSRDDKFIPCHWVENPANFHEGQGMMEAIFECHSAPISLPIGAGVLVRIYGAPREENLPPKAADNCTLYRVMRDLRGLKSD